MITELIKAEKVLEAVKNGPELAQKQLDEYVEYVYQHNIKKINNILQYVID